MKKIFMSLLVIAASLNIMAYNVTSHVVLTLSGANSGEANNIILNIVDESISAGTHLLYDGSFGTNDAYIYAYDGASKYDQYTTTDLTNFQLGIQAGQAEVYTITASGVVGTPIKLYNKTTGEKIDMVDGASITLTATAAGALNDIIVVNPVSAQTEFVCQVPAGLSFHGDQDYTGLQVLDENDNVIEAAFDLAAGEDKVVAIATAGRYYVLNGTQKIFFVVR